MPLLKGKIARSIIFMFTVLAIIAFFMAVITLQYAQYSTLQRKEITRRSDRALLSAHIRSESLVLASKINSYLLDSEYRPAGRAAILAQSQKLDLLIAQAQADIDFNDVDENLQIGTIYNLLIGFNTQALQVADTFEREQILSGPTQANLAILTQHYQQPLLEALTRFEQMEAHKKEFP